MWKRLAGNLIVTTVMLVGTGVEAQSPADVAISAPPPVGRAEVLKDIEAFKRDPTHLTIPGLRLAIMRFAQDSKDVRVVIGPKPVPWLENKSIPEDVRTNLLTAYFAGNLKSQLDRGTATNDSVAGCEQVIATYQQLQAAKPGLSVPEVEKLVALQKQGKLTEYLGDAETATSAEK